MGKFQNKIVERVLGRDFRARQDDKYLLVQVYQEYGLGLSESQRALLLSRRLPSAETITRTRRKLQADGKYPPSKAVADARVIKEQEAREELRRNRNSQLPF